MGMEINDLPGIDRAYWKGRSLIKNGLSVWIWGGLVVNFALLVFNAPWGPGLGIASSPQRDTWRAVGTFFGSLPVAFWLMTYWIDHQEWVAEANGEEYEVGKYYPVVTTKRIITSAIGMALFGVSGGFFWSPMLDVPGLAWQILAVAYDPVVCWFAVTFGFTFIRAPLQGQFNPLYLWYIGISDAPILMFVACWWWRRWRPMYLKGEMSLYRASIEYVLLGTLVHRLGSRYTFGARYMTPDPAWWAGTFTSWINPWNHIQFMGIKFIGVYIGAALGRYVWMKKPEYKILE